MSDTQRNSKTGMWLWMLAILLMVLAAGYQRRTGPTNPLKGSFNVGEQQMKYRLPRSAENTSDAVVVIPDPGMTARLLWRRYPTNDPFTVVFMAPVPDGNKRGLIANIPFQEAAGKVEYKIEIDNSTIPDGEEAVILRFKGPVSASLLIPHILVMFGALLVSTRAGLGASFGMDEKQLPLVTLGMIIVGGLILGALVQKSAFGVYWAGWPFGSDLTDNKTLIMFIGWLTACLVASFPRFRRTAIVLASMLTLIVYLIPHSLRGSQLDYQHGTIQTDR